MLKGSLISIILLVIIYQVYIIYYEDNIDSEESVSSNKPHVIEEESNIKQTHYETSENFEHPVLGKPDKIIPESNASPEAVPKGFPTPNMPKSTPLIVKDSFSKKPFNLKGKFKNSFSGSK